MLKYFKAYCESSAGITTSKVMGSPKSQGIVNYCNTFHQSSISCSTRKMLDFRSLVSNFVWKLNWVWLICTCWENWYLIDQDRADMTPLENKVRYCKTQLKNQQDIDASFWSPCLTALCQYLMTLAAGEFWSWQIHAMTSPSISAISLSWHKIHQLKASWANAVSF